MKLETQLAKLAELGIEVEREPWSRQICEQVWNFDTECIIGNGNYVMHDLQKAGKRCCCFTSIRKQPSNSAIYAKKT